MKKTRLFLLSAFLICLYSLTSAQNTDGDTTENNVLKSENPKFEIAFPGPYKIEKSEVEDGLQSKFYRCLKGDNVYMFKFDEHKNPVISSDNKTYTDASIESFMNGVGADLIKKYEFKEKKYKGTEALLRLDNENLYVFYRVIIVKHNQFQIIVISKTDKKTDEINSFFDSFKI